MTHIQYHPAAKGPRASNLEDLEPRDAWWPVYVMAFFGVTSWAAYAILALL